MLKQFDPWHGDSRHSSISMHEVPSLVNPSGQSNAVVVVVDVVVVDIVVVVVAAEVVDVVVEAVVVSVVDAVVVVTVVVDADSQLNDPSVSTHVAVSGQSSISSIHSSILLHVTVPILLSQVISQL